MSFFRFSSRLPLGAMIASFVSGFRAPFALARDLLEVLRTIFDGC